MSASWATSDIPFPGLVGAHLRAAAKAYNDVLDAELPDGPDKTFVIRAHRSNAMWANVAITRLPDGTPRG